MIAALVMTTFCHAANLGDYLYTLKGKFKVIGENQIVNGNFADAENGWTNIDGTALSMEQWSIEPSVGPNGENALMSTNAVDNSVATKTQIFADHIYAISFCAKASAPLTTSTTAAGARYLGIYTNKTGEYSTTAEGYRLIGGVKSITTEWQTFTDTITCTEGEYLCFVMQNMSEGAMFTNISVNEIQQVADDREIQVLADYARSLLGNENFPNGRADFEEAILELESMKDVEDIEIVNEVIKQFEDPINAFLEENSANATEYIPNANFDDLTNTKMVKTTPGALGNWVLIGSRWQALAPDANFDTYHMHRQIQSKNTMADGYLSQKMDFPAGKYMFTMKVMGRRYTSVKNSTDIDESATYDGVKLFINNDSTECQQLSIYNPHRFYVIADIAQGDSINVGISIPGFTNGGGEVIMDMTDLRWIGGDVDKLAEYKLGKELAEAKLALKAAITTGKELYASKDYIFGKKDLNDSIVKSEEIYNTVTIIDSLNNQTKRMTRANTYFKKLNLEYTTLNGSIAQADEIIADDVKYKSDKTALIAANNDAKGYVGTLTEESERDSLTLMTYNDKLVVEINKVLSATNTDDEKYSFLDWANEEGAVYTSLLADTLVYTSSNTALKYETAPFGNHSLNNRLAYLDNEYMVKDLDTKNGLKVTYTKKNATVLALMNLKQGDKVTVDWAMGNASHHHYIRSGNVSYQLGDSTVVLTSVKEKDAATMIANNTNTDGVNSFNRTIYTMTKDGSIDFYFGSSNATMYFSYIGITYNKVLAGDANGDGTVDVTDITTIASYILGTTPESWNAQNADANNDGNIDVTDITTTASIILGN